MPDRVVVGIDVAATRPCTAVAVRAGRVAEARDWYEAAAVKELVSWVHERQPVVVAVDAPQGFNKRLLAAPRPGQAVGSLPAEAVPASSRSRVCDYELLRRRLGVYQVPARADVTDDSAKLPDWMAVGFRLFRELRHLHYEVPSEDGLPGAFGQPPALLEVYPYAAFVAINGRLLPRKSERQGLRRRVQLLRAAGVRWDQHPEKHEEYYDHDSLDALAAALTAARYLQGVATAIGHAGEGLIWLPVTAGALQRSYST
jgi:predicted nuclease with RNAse H fold